MFCRHCGTECPPSAAYCPSCGRMVDSTLAAGSIDPGDAAAAKTIQSYLALAIFSTVLCCMPFGIPGIVFAVQARTRHRLGDTAGAEESLAKAKTWSWLSFGFGLIIPLFYLFVFIASLVSEVG